MAKNRKNKSVAIRFGPAIKALLLCAFFVVSGVGYVWQKSLIVDLDCRAKASAQELDTLKKLNEKVRKQLAEMTTTKKLKERLIDLKLGLASPSEAQVWRLTEPAGPPTVSPAPAIRRYAARP